MAAPETLAVVDPWTHARLAEVPLAAASEVPAIEARAREAFEGTRALPSHARRALLAAIADGLDAKRDRFEELLVSEIGKPRPLAKIEVGRALTTFRLGAEEATRLVGEALPLDLAPGQEGLRGTVWREPRGPVLAIAPFNFPLNLVAHKVAPALACGASVVLKPPPQAPLCSLLLGEIVTAACAKAGAPQHALQVVPCANDVAEALVRSDAFGVLSFTGSDKVGWKLAAIAGKKRATLELGGNAAALVHDDAAPDDAALDKLVDLLVKSAYGFAGQVCIKTQRLLVQRALAPKLVDALVARVRALAPADPRGEDTLLGPMVDAAAAARVDGWIEAAVRAGAEALVRGARGRGEHENRLGPSLVRLAGDGAGLALVDDELFGPGLVVQTYDTWDEALTLANRSRFGLQVGVFTESRTLVRRAVERLRVGGVVVGDTASVRVDAMPYGGVGDSGLGREGVRYAMQDMTEPKIVVERG